MRRTLNLFILTLFASGIGTNLVAIDDLPDYERVSGVSGTLSSVGSDTLATLMTLRHEESEKQ